MSASYEYNGILNLTREGGHAVNNMVTRRTNALTVVQYLYEKGEATALSISSSTGLSIPTVTSIIKDLKKEGFLGDTRQLQSSGGRRPVIYTVDYDACLAVGADVFKRCIRFAMINLKTKAIATDNYDIPFENSRDYWRSVKNFADGFLEKHLPTGKRFLGFSFSFPCIFDRENPRKIQVIKSLKVDEVNLDYLDEFFGRNTPVMNNGRLAGFSAVWNRKLKNTTAYILLNKEVSGAVLTTQWVVPEENRTGEFGHVRLVPEGKLCSCGQRGCFNAYCSALVLTDASGAGLEEFFKHVEDGEARFTGIWEEYMNNLAIFINNIHMALDCDVIVGGFVSAYLHKWEDALREKISAISSFEEKCSYLSISEYGMVDACRGAGIRLISQYLENLGAYPIAR